VWGIARRAFRPVPARAPPHRQKSFLQNVLDVTSWQHTAQPGSEPRRVPGEQFPQRGVVTACHGGDQLVVVHCFSIALCVLQVHPGTRIFTVNETAARRTNGWRAARRIDCSAYGPDVRLPQRGWPAI